MVLLRFAFIAVFISILTVFPSLCFAGFGVVPSDIELQVKAGEEYEGFFDVNSSGEDTKRISIKVVDWQLSENGEALYDEAGTLPRSCAKWLRISPMEFELVGDATQRVLYSFTLPEDAKGSYWVMLDVEGAPPLDSKKGGITVVGVIGMQFFVTESENSIKDGEISNVTVIEPKDNAPYKVAVEFTNTGNAILRNEGRVEIKDEEGKLVTKVPVKKFFIFPGAKRIMEVPLDKELSKGEYNALAILDFKGDHLVAGEANFEVK